MRSIGRVFFRAFALGSVLAFVIAPGQAQSPNEPNNTEAKIFFPDEAFRPLTPNYNGAPASTVVPARIYFPPVPPPLGQAITPSPSRAPAELAAYVNETFYPALGTRLEANKLSDSLRDRLDRYHAAKLALQHELRTELDHLREAEPALRTSELIAFSRRQTPKIVELEVTAEELRRDLVIRRKTWGAIREWHLGDDDLRGYTPAEVAGVMRAAAFYEDGLSLVQRGLLREIAIELETPADSTANASVAQPHQFFSPSPALVRPPDDLPADVASQLATYQTRKSALKKELYDAVYASDNTKHRWLHGNPLKGLATKQTERLAELETLAEEIRRSLEHAVVQVPAEDSSLPPTLQARVDRLIAGHFAAQKEVATKIETIVATAKDVRLSWYFRFEGGRLRYQVHPTPDLRRTGRKFERFVTPEQTERVDAVRAEVAAAASAYERHLADFIKERDSIRAEAVEALGSAIAGKIESTLDVALTLAATRDTTDLYHDYHLAIFQPGLSPEQRRLLFDGAIERLQLPLPLGVLQPKARRATR